MGNMGYSYKRMVGLGLGRRSCHGGRGGFRLNPKRFSVLIRVRVRLMYLFRLCDQALQSLKRSMINRNRRSTNNGTGTPRRSRRRCRSSSSRMSLVMDGGGGGGDCRFRSFGRTNSFYAEAIADCLEFIKRSSISVDDITQATQDRL